MKTRVLSILALATIASASPGLAQESRISIGPLGGAVVADQAGEDVFAPHDVFGFLGGVSGVLRLSDRWSVQLDGLYVEKGGRENNDEDPGDPDDDELSLRYLEFPVLARFALGRDGGTRPAIFAGPSFAFELDCTWDTFPGGSSTPVPCADAGLRTRALDVGLAFGADVEIPAGSGHFVIDARGIVGLGTFDDSGAGLDFRNRFLTLAAGYRFRL